MEVCMKGKRRIAAILVICMMAGLCGCGQSIYEVYNLVPNEYLTEDEALEGGGEDSTGNDSQDSATQLTVEDIQRMNEGKAQIVYSSEGYVTFLQGKFSEKKVENYEDAIASIQQIAGLIGLGAGSEFFSSFASEDDDGYTYYTFQQRYGELTIRNATLRVVVDREGITAGLSCSFTPNIGIAPEVKEVGEEAALQIVQQRLTEEYPNIPFTCYGENTQKLAITFNGTTYSAYAVYTNNPNANAADFDMLYIEHFVTLDGEYLPIRYPVASFGTGNIDAFRNEDYFKNMTAEYRQFLVTRYNGVQETISVPVSYDTTTNLYYLADPERKIAVGRYADVVFYSQYGNFLSSQDPTGWRNNDLLAYDRYIKAYDYYAALGLYSVDGSGMPIQVLTQFCDEQGNPVNNAVYMGVYAGWALFGTSDINNFGEAMDAVGHEYTHAIMDNSMVGNLYWNDTGAIFEAYADICGNIMEMLYGMTEDNTWLIGENSGQPLRSMSDPHLFGQPISVNDPYYHPVSDTSDNGGVHTNSSLLNIMAYRLACYGMPLEEQRSLWLTTIELLTPLSGFREVHAALLMSIDINGLNEGYKDILTEGFREAGLL